MLHQKLACSESQHDDFLSPAKSMSMTKQEDAAMNQQVASNTASLCKSASRINATFRVSVDYGRVRLQAMVLNRLVIQASMPTSSVFVARVVFMASFVSSCAPVFAIIATVFARRTPQAPEGWN